MREKVGRLANGVSTWALAALLVTLPFLGHWVPPGQPIDAVLYDFHEIALYANDLFLLAAVGGWLMSVLLRRGKTSLQWGPAFLSVPLLGLLTLSIAGIPQAVDSAYAAYMTARSAFLLVFYLMVMNLSLKEELIVWPLAAGMIVQGVVGVGQFLLGHTLGLRWLGETTADAARAGASVIMVGERRWLRAYGLTPHPNVLGGFLMACLLVVTGSYLTRSGWRRNTLLGSLAIGLGTLLLTFSRAAWLGTVAGGLVLLGLLLWARRRDSRPVRQSSLPLLAGVVLAVVLVFAAVNWPLLRPRLGLASQGVEIRSVEERVLLNKASLVLIRMRPWLGVGLGNFALALYRLAPQAVSYYSSFAPVHVVLLLVTAELGLMGGLFWLCLIVSPWLSLWLRRRQVEMTPWWAGLSAAMAALTVVSFLDHYPWSSQQGRLLIMLVLGLWAREWGATTNGR